MDASIILLRLLHIGAGVYWAGTILFFATLLEPSIRDSGPGGARVLQALGRRGYITIMPVMALITILSGVDLLRRASAGFAAAWFRTPTGLTLTAGGVVTIVAFLIGVLYLRPAGKRLAELGRDASNPAAGDSPDHEVQTLRRRLTTGARVVAVLLALAVVTMAVARYLG